MTFSINVSGRDLNDVELREDIKEINYYYNSHSLILYGVILPLICIIGMVNSILVFIAFLHPKMRGLCGKTMCFLAVADLFNLVCITWLYLPVLWLPVWSNYFVNAYFLEELSALQGVFVILFPISNVCHTLVVWYVVVYVIEFYYYVSKPREAISFTYAGSNVSKMLLTLFNVIFLIHLMSFFGLTKQESYFQSVVEYRVCLSQVYRNAATMSFEKYAYVIICFMTPIIIVLIALLGATIRLKVKHNELLKHQWAAAVFGTTDISRILKDARSFQFAWSMALFFICFEGVCLGVYWNIQHTIDFSNDPDGCRPIPIDRRFMNTKDSKWEFIYYLFQALHSALRLPVCLLASPLFRHTFWIMTLRTKTCLKKLLIPIQMCIDLCRDLEPAPKADLLKSTQPEDPQLNVYVIPDLPIVPLNHLFVEHPNDTGSHSMSPEPDSGEIQSGTSQPNHTSKEQEQNEQKEQLAAGSYSNPAYTSDEPVVKKTLFDLSKTTHLD